MKDVPPLRECERALTLEPRWRAPRVEAGITGTGTRSLTRSCPQGDARMGKARMRVPHRCLWLHARVIPAAFPSGKTGHISGAMDVNMDRQREPGMDLDKRRPQAPGPRRGSWNNRTMNPAVNPRNFVMSSGRRRDGRGQNEGVPQGPLAQPGCPGIVRDLPQLRHRHHEIEA